MDESTAPPGRGQGPTDSGDGPRVTYGYSNREGWAPPADISAHPASLSSSPGGGHPGRSADRQAASTALALLLIAVPLGVVFLEYRGVFDFPEGRGATSGMGALICVIASAAAALLRRTGREIAVPVLAGLMAALSVGAVFGLREYDERRAKAAVEDCLAGGTQPFTLNSPQLAAMQLTPAQQAVWTGMAQSWEPPEGSPVKAEDFVMRPVMYRGSVPAVALAVPGAGEERYHDEMLPAFEELPGAGTPVEVDVAGRVGYVATFSAGSALLTTNGCWGVMVVGPDAASLQATAAELVSPATTPGRPVAASRS